METNENEKDDDTLQIIDEPEKHSQKQTQEKARKQDDAKKTTEKETTKKQDNGKKTEETKNTDKEKIEELTNILKRVQADFENYKKRTEKEKTELLKYSSEEIITKILPVLDNFELALKHEEKAEECKKAMEMIYAQLYSILESEGLKPIKSEGQKFDAFKHEALIAENDKEKENNIILEEFQKGYAIGDKIIRPSKVKVNKK
jgi:molecular chaperone GrpE